MINVSNSGIKKWSLRAIKSFVQGATGAIAAALMEPNFNPVVQGGWKKFGILMLVGGIMRELLYLKAWSEAPNND